MWGFEFFEYFLFSYNVVHDVIVFSYSSYIVLRAMRVLSLLFAPASRFLVVMRGREGGKKRKDFYGLGDKSFAL